MFLSHNEIYPFIGIFVVILAHTDTKQIYFFTVWDNLTTLCLPTRSHFDVYVIYLLRHWWVWGSVSMGVTNVISVLV